MRKTGVWQPILWSGLIVGALDITYAIVSNGLRGVGWVRVLQSVGSGLLGRDAFAGGLPTAALGLACHFLNSFIIAAIFCAASRRLPWVAQRAALCGLLYGAVVYLVMSRVVVPLSAAPFTIPLRVTDLLAHLFLIGLPISLVASRYAEKP